MLVYGFNGRGAHRSFGDYLGLLDHRREIFCTPLEVVPELAGGAVDYSLDVFLGFGEVQGGHVDNSLPGPGDEPRGALLPLGSVTVLPGHVSAETGKGTDEDDRGHFPRRGE